MIRFALFVSLLCGGCSTPKPAPAATPAPSDVPDAQLPQGIAPTHYVLSLKIDPNTGVTSGTVEIALDNDEPREKIWMHGRDLNVTSVQLNEMRGHWTQVNPQGVAQITFDREVPTGMHTLTIAFHGKVADSLEGLYRVTEGDDHYAFTQFETTHARAAFPCFDEPRFKTTFDVELTVPSKHKAAANTAEVKRAVAKDGYATITYARSKPMPTYLLAWGGGATRHRRSARDRAEQCAQNTSAFPRCCGTRPGKTTCVRAQKNAPRFCTTSSGTWVARIRTQSSTS